MGNRAVAFVAGCEWVLGFFLGVYSLFAVAIGILKYKRSEHAFATFLDAIALGIACAVVCKIAAALYRGKRWGWFASWVIGAGTVWFASLCLWDAVTPKPHYSGDESLGLLAGALLLLPALTSLILMGLPKTRRFISNGRGG